VTEPLSQADHLQRGPRGSAPARRRHRAVQQPGRHVIHRGQARQQEELLEDEPDARGAERGKLAVG
jgi:hypothetical protein